MKQCEAWWKTTGRNAAAYQACQARAQKTLIECIQSYNDYKVHFMDEIQEELMRDSLTKISLGDADGAINLAYLLLSHSHEKHSALQLAAIEALVTIAMRGGSDEAKAFLNERWGAMREIYRRRLKGAGFD